MLVFNSISVFCYLVSCLALLQKYPRYAILWGYVCLMQGWSVISCYFNDFGVYNPELFTDTTSSYSTSRLAVFYLVFNLGFWFSGKMIGKKALPKLSFTGLGCRHLFPLSTKNSINVIFVISLSYLIYAFAKNGIPALETADRVEIYNSLDRLQKIFQDYGFILIFIIGFFRSTCKNFQISDAIFILFSLYLLSLGHKFSGILSLLVFYITPVWTRRVSANPKGPLLSRKQFGIVLIAITVVICVTITHYSIGNDSFEAVQQLFIDRLFAMQGHVWWAVDNRVISLGPYDPGHWVKELSAIMAPTSIPEDAVGVKYLMANIIGPENAEKIIARGYTYTMAYPAILIASFPYWLSLLIQLLAGAFFFLILFYLAATINYGYLFRAVVALTVVVPFLSTLGSGVLSTFATFGVLMKLAFLGALQFAPILLNSREPQHD